MEPIQQTNATCEVDTHVPGVSFLLISQDASHATIAREVAAPLGAEVVLAGSQAQALEQLGTCRFAGIFMDAQTLGMDDALALATMLRARPGMGATPLMLMVTAGNTAQLPLPILATLGAIDLIALPLGLATLTARMHFLASLYCTSVTASLALPAEPNQWPALLFDNAKDALVALDPSGIITHWEGIASTITGWTGSELIGTSFTCIYTPDDQAAGRAGTDLALARDTGRVEDSRWHVRKDGSRFFADGFTVPLYTASGQLRGFAKIFRDQTDQKLAQEALRQSNERFSLLLESSADGIYGMGPDSSCTFLNKAGAAMLGYAPEELIGIPIHGVIHQKYPDHSHYPVEQCHIAIAAKSGAQARVDDEVFWHKDGSAVPVSYSASPILVDGKPAGAVVTYTDVTRRKQTEEDLRSLAAQLSEANRRKGEFLATLAHELRNPLAPMRTGLSLMRLSGSNPETVGRVTDMLERQVAHMVHLVDDLLDVARISSGKVALKKSRIALHDIFAGAIETSRPTIDSANHTLSVDLPDGPIWLDADPIRLTQVLDNLLTNAAKYTPPNGRIGLSATRDGAAILIAVSDSGVGISAAAMPTLFDMFTQIGKHLSQSQGGLGIGLSLVRHLVELHDGEVMVYSEGEGAGSTFTVRLPLACEMPEAAPVPPMTANLDAAPVRSLRVVIADDNQDAALALGQLLSLQGHSVHVVHDGDAALQLMRTFAPDIMILDIGMPVMNGYEVARAVRLAALPAAPVLIALTGWGTDKDRARATEAGFDYHFTKPGKSSEIAALFATIAGKRRAGAINKATE